MVTTKEWFKNTSTQPLRAHLTRKSSAPEKHAHLPHLKDLPGSPLLLISCLPESAGISVIPLYPASLRAESFQEYFKLKMTSG